MSKYLVINAGSSSLKFSMYEMPSEQLIINGYFEKSTANVNRIFNKTKTNCTNFDLC